MNKRQKKKSYKKWLVKVGLSTDGNLYCVGCGKKLSFSDEFQMLYEACDSTCYAKSVGVYWD